MFGLFKGEEGKRGERRYTGTIITVPGQDGFGFIGINTVALENGDPHDISTEKDIFLHRDDCSETPRVGMAVSFTVVPDQHRGPGTFRAMGAVRLVEAELLPSDGEAVPGLGTVMARLAGDALPIPVEFRRTQKQAGMKDVPAEAVEQALGNNPLAGIRAGAPRDDAEKIAVLRELLARLYPWMEFFDADFNPLTADDTELNAKLDEAEQAMGELGLTAQIPLMKEQAGSFRSIRSALAMLAERNLVRRDTFIPLRNLPDLFMACPVWYHWVKPEEDLALASQWEASDPYVPERVMWFCDLFKNDLWRDTFQLYNRRVRSFKQYKGEQIPPHALTLMREAVKLFDYVVIATPYHDQAGKDWQDLKWLRAIDPYVLAFKKGLPVFFVIGRFSDAGTFPLLPELVADSIQFLKENKEKLAGFNAVGRPYWYRGVGSSDCAFYDREGYLDQWEHRRRREENGIFGYFLQEHVDQLVRAFEAGHLFEWLRGEWTLPAAEIPAGVGVEDPVRFGGV